MGLKREFTEFESACFNGDLNKVQRLVDKNNINEGLSCACEGNWMEKESRAKPLKNYL